MTMTRRTEGRGDTAAGRPHPLEHPDGGTGDVSAAGYGWGAEEVADVGGGGAVGRPRRRLIVRAAGVVAVMALAAACGGSSKPASPPATSPATPPPATTTTPTTTPSPAPTPGTTATEPADPAAAKAQITQNWQAFFDPKTSITDKAKYLENGTQLTALLQGFSSDPRVGQVSAVVTNVAFTSPTTATVTYQLSLQGTVVEPNATGKAVLRTACGRSRPRRCAGWWR
jgi:hypothetical protein